MLPLKNSLLAICVLFASAKLVGATTQLGDLDGDGVATVFDLTRLIAHINSDPELTAFGRLTADMDQDGDVDQVDVQLLRDAVLLRRDLEEPTLSYTLAANDELVSNVNTSIAGVSFPGTNILVEGALTPKTAVVGEDGQFDIGIILKENQLNRIFVTVFDEDGNASPPRALQIRHDAQPPNLFIDFPAENSQVITEKVDIAGRVGDMLSGYRGLDVKVNGDAAAVIVGIGQNGTFERSQVPVMLGKNVISVTAMDALGNTVTKTKTLFRIEPTGPVIETVSGNNQAQIVNEVLSEPAVVRIRYPNGTPIANKFVTFKVIKSNGMLAESSEMEAFAGAGLSYQTLTDSSGLASVHWRLGHDAGCGNNRLQVTSKDVTGTAFFCASGVAAPPSQINIGSGNNQRGATGSFSVEPLRVWVNDSCNGAEDISVLYRVISGGGTVNGQDSVVVQTTRTGHAGVEFKFGSDQGNNIIEADFEGNPGPPATFVAFGVGSQSGSGTVWEGIIHDNASNPIGGAECQLEIGGILQPKVLSDINGVFRMENIPAGTGHLHVEGLVATHLNGEEIPIGSFPALNYEVLVVENAVNSLGEAVLLPPLDPVNARVFDNSEDLVLTCAGIEGLKMTIKAGSMRLADGTKPDWRNPAIVSLNQVHHDDTPMPMPDGVSPPFAWTLQPAGATFDVPVQIEYPNMKGLAPGAVAYFLSYDHDMEEFVIIASGHVTDDGSTIVTDAGVGIEKAGWGCNCPPYSVTTDCKNCEYECKAKGSFTGGTTGVVSETVCEGETLTFTASGVEHEGGQLVEKCPEREDKVIDVKAIPYYEWTITSTALPGGSIRREGKRVSIPNAKEGNYTASVRVTARVPTSATVNCVPDPISLSNVEACVVKVDLNVTKEVLTLMEENTLTAAVAKSGVNVTNYKFEIRRKGKATWHLLASSASPTFTGTARVAGKFDVRVTATIDGVDCVSESKDIEAQFPTATEILAGTGVATRMATAWTATKNATTATTRREEGYYITLNTATGAYGITAHSLGNTVMNNETAGWHTATFPRPPDSIANPTPLDQPTYTVAWFHTHTPMTHRTGSRGVGPSGADFGWSANASINCPGYAYDYVESPAGSGVIPGGHPIDSDAKAYIASPPTRRPTP